MQCRSPTVKCLSHVDLKLLPYSPSTVLVHGIPVLSRTDLYMEVYWVHQSRQLSFSAPYILLWVRQPWHATRQRKGLKMAGAIYFLSISLHEVRDNGVIFNTICRRSEVPKDEALLALRGLQFLV